ncbi:M23 family metallopeptidase [Proteinivorax tanatarense]|uniref:M23 family metallopeptidase n=1 Tax=Proteinivorax tanatarense TaxID=1260629 RepID=A0AAU7VLB2_9FIRM
MKKYYIKMKKILLQFYLRLKESTVVFIKKANKCIRQGFKKFMGLPKYIKTASAYVVFIVLLLSFTFWRINSLPSFSVQDTPSQPNVENKMNHNIYDEMEISRDFEDEKGEEKEEPITEQESEEVTTEIANLSWPLQGEVVKKFNDMWTLNSTHQPITGIAIQAETDSKVRAALSGSVEQVYNDPMHGNTVVIANEKYTTVYSSLSSEILVNEGQKVSKGDSLGTPGNSSLLDISPSFLLFEVTEINSEGKSEYIDPLSLLE